MEYVVLANGVKMPIFGLGTFRVEPGESAYETVLTALKIGYRHIDTAQMYHNEASIGEAWRASGIKREDLFITSKMRDFFGGDLDKIEERFNQSLKDLQTDYLDLFLIHWPNHDWSLNQKAWTLFEKLYKEGKVKAIGVSNFQIHHIDNLLETAKVVPHVDQIELHPGLQQKRVRQYLAEKGIAVTSYGPFMKGEIFQGTMLETLTEVGNKYNLSPAQTVVAWGISSGIIMIPKSVNEERLKQNFDARLVKLDKEDIEKIDKLNRGRRVYTDPDNNPLMD